MIISFIVAADLNNAIGFENKLPWRLKRDMKFFKETTMGNPILMGRKTFESFGGKPLPGRLNIVVTRDKTYVAPEGVLVFHSIMSAITRMEQEENEEGFIIGGAEIYSQAMEYADRIYLTRVNCVIEKADSFFPKIDTEAFCRVSSEDHPADENNQYPMTFIKYEKI